MTSSLLVGVLAASLAAEDRRIAVRRAPGKGRGAFATVDFAKGSRVCSYEGERLTREQVAERFGSVGGAYLFDAGNGEFIDGARSSHVSRFINHAERGNLDARTARGRVQFYATRRIRAGDELCFDYGEKYWVCCVDGPLEGTDSRIEVIQLRRELRRSGMDGWVPSCMESSDGGSEALGVVAAARNLRQAVKKLRGGCTTLRVATFAMG